MKIYEVEERTALGGASFEYLGRNMVSKIMEFGKLQSTSRIRRQLDFMNIWILKHINEPILLRVDGFRITARNNGKSV